MSPNTISIFLEAITPQHLWLIFFMALLYTAIMSWVLIYHWRVFGTNNKTFKLIKGLYITVTLFIVLSLIFFLLLF